MAIAFQTSYALLFLVSESIDFVFEGNCIIGCTPLSDCGSDDKGLFADVRYFYVAEVDIPDEVGDRYLQALILQEQTEMEKNNQQAAVVRKETSQLVKNIQNEANEMDKYADAMSTLIMSKANANASAIREQARVDGLKLIFTDTKMQDDAHKASLDYLRTLRRMENAHISVDFTQFISGPTSP